MLVSFLKVDGEGEERRPRQILTTAVAALLVAMMRGSASGSGLIRYSRGDGGSALTRRMEGGREGVRDGVQGMH
jgi:hypothetical protein